MKIKTFLAAMMISFGLFSQNFEGTITYELSYDNLPAEAKAYESMLPKETVVTVANDVSKSVTDNPMTGMPTVIITNNESGESYQLQDVMGEKYAIKFNSDEENDEEAETEYEETGEEKEISGYKCKVATAETENAMLTVCYTKDLPAIKNERAKGLDGFPLEIIMETDQITFIQTVSKIDQGKTEKLKFEVPKGYTEISFKDFQEKYGQGGM